WIGGQAQAPGFIGEGSEVRYTLTVVNNGDSPATNVVVVDDYDEGRLSILERGGGADDGSALSFSIGSLSPGASAEVSYVARLGQVSAGTDVTNRVEALLRETDEDYGDNTDTLTIRTSVEEGSSGGSHGADNEQKRDHREEDEAA